MKNYEKPMVIINEELAEGVYAASGCWSISTSRIEDKGSGWFFAYITVTHDDVAHNGDAIMTVTFSEPVTLRNANYKALTSGESSVHSFSRSNPINAGGCNWQITIEGDTKSGSASNLSVSVAVVDNGE